MKPRNFYDLVIEVAIIRPGPIQGDMVHPYIRRRDGLETVEFPSQELEDVLGKTLGVPLFQEQAMQIAIVAAGFTPGEADQLRRAMATFRKTGTIHTFHTKMVDGMAERGYDRDFAERCFRQIEGFGEYGFPESHAASFALLVYVSSWLKCHYPDVFAAALLNSQPMGFYAPAQIVRDAREHDVEVRGPDVNYSLWDNRLEPLIGDNHALRLGFRQIKSLNREAAEAVVDARPNEGYVSVEDVWRRTNINTAALVALAEAGGFDSLGLARREALWAIRALGHNGRETAAALPLFAAAEARDAIPETPIALPGETAGEVVANDYAAIRMSLKHHPVGLLRGELDEMKAVPARELRERPNDQRLTTAGLILVRQRPGTAKGVIFLTLEDETGVANVIVWPDVFERFRKVVLSSRLVRIRGKLQREGIVTHLIAEEITDLSARLDALGDGSAEEPREFENAWARADEIKYGVRPDPRKSVSTGRKLAKPSLWRHPRNTHIAIKSRNFH